MPEENMQEMLRNIRQHDEGWEAEKMRQQQQSTEDWMAIQAERMAQAQPSDRSKLDTCMIQINALIDRVGEQQSEIDKLRERVEFYAALAIAPVVGVMLLLAVLLLTMNPANSAQFNRGDAYYMGVLDGYRGACPSLKVHMQWWPHLDVLAQAGSEMRMERMAGMDDVAGRLVDLERSEACEEAYNFFGVAGLLYEQLVWDPRRCGNVYEAAMCDVELEPRSRYRRPLQMSLGYRSEDRR